MVANRAGAEYGCRNNTTEYEIMLERLPLRAYNGEVTRKELWADAEQFNA